MMSLSLCFSLSPQPAPLPGNKESACEDLIGKQHIVQETELPQTPNLLVP